MLFSVVVLVGLGVVVVEYAVEVVVVDAVVLLFKVCLADSVSLAILLCVGMYMFS